MPDQYSIAIIGAGPAGLSAAGRAAYYERQEDGTGPDHILLESAPHHANTIQHYQKGKHVMDEPGYLELRSPMEFSSGKREQILETWRRDIAAAGINLRLGAEVAELRGEQGNFQIRCADGYELTAETVVLAIGVQGNPRKLGVEGEDSSFVQYQLDDPDAYSDEDIVVVGAGDAAIENALALSKQNRVVIVNRRNEFSRAKQGNLDAVLAAINNRNIPFSCYYEANIKALQPAEEGGCGSVTLNTPHGDVELPCHRVVARLGSIPPRRFVEGCGIELPGDQADAVPELDGYYQSNVPGLYVIGALAGYPLIKQGLNQGYDVVEYIKGHDIKPADHPLLQLKFSLLPYAAEVDEILALYQKRIPMFARMNALAFRELIMESEIRFGVADDEMLEELRQKGEEKCEQRRAEILAQREESDRQRREAGKPATPKPVPEPEVTRLMSAGEYIYRDGEYSNSFFTIVEGEVELSAADGPVTRLGAGQFFGEMSLLSGRPRAGDARAVGDVILIETPRRIMAKLMAANREVAEGIETVFLQRTLQQFFAPSVSYSALRDVAREVSSSTFNKGETIYREGEQGDRLYLIRSGAVELRRRNEITVGQLQSGHLFGQMALMGDPERRESAVASVRCEVIEIEQSAFLALLRLSPDSVPALQAETSQQLKYAAQLEAVPESGSVISFLLDQGLGEATDALVIDENLCIGCDNCEIACAETHDGVSRLNRKSGVRYAHINLPIACRHCEQPHCMKECPPNAIRRAPDGEVFINDSCIGCGNCETNCPYDVIKMTYPAPEKPGFLNWLLFGSGPGPGEDAGAEPTEEARDAGKKAVKCDACVDRPAGPACVQSCPTGAARRFGPDAFASLVNER